MDKRYYLHSDRAEKLLSMRHSGLGQPVCAGLEHGSKHGCRIVSEGVGRAKAATGRSEAPLHQKPLRKAQKTSH